MRLLGAFAVGFLTLNAACGGGGGDDNGGPGPTPQQTLNEIRPAVTTLNLSAGGTATIQMTALDTQGATISNPGSYSYTSRSATIAEVNQTGAVVAISAGSTTIDISLTRAGVTKQATVAVTVSGQLGLSATVAAGVASNTFQPPVVAIAAGGSVTWTFGSVQHNVNFSGSSGAPNNIGNSTNTMQTRMFNTTGNFSYDCNLHAGMTGTVLVR